MSMTDFDPHEAALDDIRDGAREKMAQESLTVPAGAGLTITVNDTETPAEDQGEQPGM